MQQLTDCTIVSGLMSSKDQFGCLPNWPPSLISWQPSTDKKKGRQLAGTNCTIWREKWRPFLCCQWKEDICPGQMSVCQGQVSRRSAARRYPYQLQTADWLVPILRFGGKMEIWKFWRQKMASFCFEGRKRVSWWRPWLSITSSLFVSASLVSLISRLLIDKWWQLPAALISASLTSSLSSALSHFPYLYHSHCLLITVWPLVMWLRLRNRPAGHKVQSTKSTSYL
jgi:hypothetical protein